MEGNSYGDSYEFLPDIVVLFFTGDRPGHGPPDPTNLTRPARKKPDPARPGQINGRARAKKFSPVEFSSQARARILARGPAR